MNTLKHLRLLLQIAAMAIFSYQMAMAYKKYKAETTITTTDTKSILESRLPTITICTMDQFDIERSKEMGYKALHNVVIGRCVEHYQCHPY